MTGEQQNGTELASPTQQPVVINRKCHWEWCTEDSDTPYQETGCDHTFVFTEGGIAENDFKFCPYCGGDIYVTVEFGGIDTDL